MAFAILVAKVVSMPWLWPGQGVYFNVISYKELFLN